MTTSESASTIRAMRSWSTMADLYAIGALAALAVAGLTYYLFEEDV